MTDRSLYYSESVSEFMKSVFAIFLILTLLLVIPTSYSFADEDDDDKKSKFKKHKVHTGNGPPPNGLATVGDLYIDSANPDNLIVYKKINKNTWQNLGAFEGEPGPQGETGPAGPQGETGPIGPSGTDGQDGTSDPRADSFFDVFFDVFQDTPTQSGVDSFFDIFTELQTDVDSFFDIFTELQADVDRIDTELLALDLRGESCDVGMVVTGINSGGSLVCAPDNAGTGSIGRLQIIERVDSTPGIFSENTATTSSFALCLPGEIVVGGGYHVSPALVDIFGEYRGSSGGVQGWIVDGYYIGFGSITAIAYCATIAE